MSERLTDEGLRAWAARRPYEPIEEAILRVLDENAALRIEAGLLMEELGHIIKDCLVAGGDGPDTQEKWESRRDRIRYKLQRLLEKVPLSAAAVERRKVMERVVEAADALEAIIKAELPEDPSMDTDRDAQVRRLCFEVFNGLAALDRTGETRKE